MVTLNRRGPPASRLRRQGGLALVVVLLFLVAITGIAVFAARKSMLDEGTGRNQLDMETARQAAESALRDGERDILGNIIDASHISCSRGAVLTFDTDCTGGLCRRDADNEYAASNWATAASGSKVGSEPWWPGSRGGLWNDIFDDKPQRTPPATGNCGFKGAVPLGTYTGVAAVIGVAYQPEYLVEYFKKKIVGGQEADAYRITARGFGYTRRTQVVLQTVIVTGY